MAKALEIWSRETIEEAPGEEAERVLPRAVRLVELRARVPRYQVASTQYVADHEGTTIARVAKAQQTDLNAPGTADALHCSANRPWPCNLRQIRVAITN